MERSVIFRENQEVTPEDLQNIGDFAGASLDHVVLDAIEGARRFVGFVTTAPSSLSVNVAAGRLYYDGAVYFRDEPDGVTLDLNSARPLLQKRIVAIVVWPAQVELAEQERDFEVDPATGEFVPQGVNMERRRSVRIEAIPGLEAVSAEAPAVTDNAVTIAWVTMDPAGVQLIERNDFGVLPNLSLVNDRVVALEQFEEEVGPQVSTMRSDLARLAADAAAGGDKELLLQVAGDIASVKARLDLPDSYVGYRAMPFLSTAQSNTGAAGYAARIEEGLRFPTAARDTRELALLNPNQPDARVSGGGLLLPAHNKVERRITKGDNGVLSLAEYSAQEERTMVRLSMSRSRIRFGGDFEVTVGSAFWNAGSYTDRLNGGIRGVFEKDGEQFQVYDTGRIDQDGHKIVRLAKFWTDEVASPYWSRLTTEQNVLGYAHVETFLNTQDRWVTDLGPHMKGKPINGSMIVGVCETYRGEPDFERILSMTTVQAADVQLVGVAGEFPRIPIEPTFQKGGERYGYFIVTQHPFQIGVADGQNAASQGATGTYFYGLNGGRWFAQPGTHMIWRDWSASFPKSKVDIDLGAIDLAGGIQMIDILADAVVPGSTDLVFSVLVGGAWRPLDAFDPGALDGLSNVLQMRATFIGTPDVMPGVRLAGSEIKFGRLATAAKHVSVVKNLPAASSVITQIIRMRGFDPAHHTITPTIIRAGNVETPDAIVDQVLPDGGIQKTCTFNLAAATAAYHSIIDMGTDSALRPFTVSEVIEIAG